MMKTAMDSDNHKVQTQGQPWLCSAQWDCLWILGPAFVSTGLVLAFRNQIEIAPSLPLWAWVSFVLCVDVAHVYATLFRTYFNKNAVERNVVLLIGAPLLCWSVGSLLYAVHAILFWRALAYLAVFHFTRQQYGFVALYSRKEPHCSRLERLIDQLAVYGAMIYPLLFWHTNLPRNFDWFVDGDFVSGLPSLVSEIGLVAYGLIVICYAGKECLKWLQTKTLNVPKNLIISGTALSWWVGIVSIDSDLAFTMTNVLTHGIPYIALIWLYERRSLGLSRESEELRPSDESSASTIMLVSQNAAQCATLKTSIKTTRPEGSGVFGRFNRLALSHLTVFVLSLLVLAYLEEGLWAGFIWREHLSVFHLFAGLPACRDPQALAVLVPLLSLPQSTHYVLDGFIWRIKDRTSIWSA